VERGSDSFDGRASAADDKPARRLPPPTHTRSTRAPRPNPPRNRATGASTYALNRDLEITSDNTATLVDWNFLNAAINIGPNRTLLFRDISLRNMRRGAGLAADFAVGSGGSWGGVGLGGGCSIGGWALLSRE